MENQANEKAPVFKVPVDVVCTSAQLDAYLEELENKQALQADGDN